MSQIEQDFRLLLSKNPEIEKCYANGLINRRSLARYLIDKGIANKNQFDAVIAMLRRFGFPKPLLESKNMFAKVRVNIKDNILVCDFERSKEMLMQLQKIISKIDYDKGDTLKIVIGSKSIKLFIDKKNETLVKENISKRPHKLAHITELSLMFEDRAIDSKGILSLLTKELSLNDIVITEFLTASPELILYLEDKYVLKTYEIIKRLQTS